MTRRKAPRQEGAATRNPGSTRAGWALIAAGLALLAGAMILAVNMPVPWGYLVAGILGVPASVAISLGLIERRGALEHRRIMADLTARPHTLEES